MPEHDLTIYAGYTQKKATVTFVLYDDESMTEQVELGGMMHRPDDPIRDGYAFAGWYTMATGGEAVDLHSLCRKTVACLHTGRRLRRR